jgi:hypothetical protein
VVDLEEQEITIFFSLLARIPVAVVVEVEVLVETGVMEEQLRIQMVLMVFLEVNQCQANLDPQEHLPQ